MSRYHQYANGLYGKQYKGYYIGFDRSLPRGAKGRNYVADGNGSVVIDHVDDYDIGIWEIDKLVMSEEEKDLVGSLFEQDLHLLNRMIKRLSGKKEAGEISPPEEILLDWATKVRNRKDKDMGF